MIELGDGPVLALDASTRRVGCAARAGGREGELVVREGAIEHLPGAVEAVLAAVGASTGELKGIVVGAGPGSYIGVRTAVTFANGLSYATGCPIVSVSGLDSLAFEAAGAGDHVLAGLEAGRGRVYAATYRAVDEGLVPHDEPALLEAEAFLALAAAQPPGTRACGNGALAHREALRAAGLVVVGAGDGHPSARVHLRLAERAPMLATPHDVAQAVPRYLGSQPAAGG